MTDVMFLCAGLISLAVADAVRLRFRLGRLGRYHTRIDFPY